MRDRLRAVPTTKGGRLLRRVGGGPRVPKGASFSPALRRFIDSRAVAWGVSRSAVIVSMCAWAANVDPEDC